MNHCVVDVGVTNFIESANQITIGLITCDRLKHLYTSEWSDFLPHFYHWGRSHYGRDVFFTARTFYSEYFSGCRLKEM